MATGRTITERFAILCLLLLLPASVGYSQEDETFSARQALDRMVSVYASCRSYLDKGQVKEIYFKPDGNRIVIKPFATAFVRPSRFRFEFTENSGLATQRYVVWRDESSIRSWWSIKPEIKYYEALGPAVAAATGVSSLSAIVVPSMLFQNLGDRHLVQSLTEPYLVKEEKISGKPAYRIEGKDLRNRSMAIWIDKESFLLVKLFERTEYDSFTVEMTITYKPQINLDVPAGKLAFKH